MRDLGPQEMADQAARKLRAEDKRTQRLNDAAPDMYEALKDVMSICKLTFGDNFCKAAADIPGRLQEVEAILAKAEGRE